MAHTRGTHHRVADPLRLVAPYLAATLADHGGQVLPILSRPEVEAALVRLTSQEIDNALRHRVFPVVIAPGHLSYACQSGAPHCSAKPAVAAVPRRELLWALQKTFDRRLKRASEGRLQVDFPDLSAKRVFTRPQIAVAIAVAALAACLGAWFPHGLASLLRLLFCLFFMAVVAVKGLAIVALFERRKPPAPAKPARDLPRISVLVPLHRETAVLDQLMGGLLKLRYPAHKLDIKLVIEQSDTPMRTACDALRLPDHMEVIVVPAFGPQTKPKALNYALQFASGDIISVFDAEDLPDPGQLAKVAASFAALPPDVICLQASLCFYNANRNWLTRQFALEYASLFEFVLPSLAMNGLPIPLGGTSNHFRAVALRKIGAWDAHNVTEDADLGLRTARLGLRTETLASRTHEEATSRLANWMRQRARWQKGYMVTWLVHMRAPNALRRDIGLANFLVMQAMMLGTTVSALLHPLFLALLAWDMADGTAFPRNPGLLQLLINGAGLAILFSGYGIGMVLGVLAAIKLRSPRLLWSVPAMPLYWLLISIASWRAFWELIVSPHHWHKTEHGTARKRQTRLRQRML